MKKGFYTLAALTFSVLFAQAGFAAGEQNQQSPDETAEHQAAMAQMAAPGKVMAVTIGQNTEPAPAAKKVRRTAKRRKLAPAAKAAAETAKAPEAEPAKAPEAAVTQATAETAPAAVAKAPAGRKKKVRKVTPLVSKGEENIPPLVVPKLTIEPKVSTEPVKLKVEPILVPTAKKEQDRTKPAIEETVLPPYMPIAERLANQLSVPLKFSIKQQERVVKTLRYEIDEPIRKLFRNYEEQREKARRNRFELNAITMEMFLMKAQIYEDIRPMLDGLQAERLDHLVYNGYFNMYNGSNKGFYVTDHAPLYGIDEAPAEQPARQ